MPHTRIDMWSYTDLQESGSCRTSDEVKFKFKLLTLIEQHRHVTHINQIDQIEKRHVTHIDRTNQIETRHVTHINWIDRPINLWSYTD